MQSQQPKTLDEAVKICLMTVTLQEKQEVKNTPEEELTMFHFGWAMNMRNEFGMWVGNDELIKSCGANEPDGASMVIVKEVWRALNRQP